MSSIAIGVIVLVILIFFSMGVKKVPEYEQGVIFRLGRVIGTRGPGLFFIFPFIDRMVRVDMRIITIDIPPRLVVAPDRVSIQASAKVSFKIVDPVAAITKAVDPIRATEEISRENFRSLLEQAVADKHIQFDELSETMQKNVENRTAVWGVKVVDVEFRQFGQK